MLPNLKFLICGILFCVLLFVVTGAGVMLPDSRTHIGEMPEIGRPMMQRSMADVPAQTQVYVMTARRNDELERLREPAPAQTEPDSAKADQPNPGQPNPDSPKPDLVATVTPDGPQTSNPAATANGAAGEDEAMSVPVPPAAATPPAEARSDDQPNEAVPLPQVVALAPASAEDSPAIIRRFVNVPLPPPRPADLGGLPGHARIFHHRRRALPQYDTAISGAPSQTVTPGQAITNPGVAAGYNHQETR
jgi:hypothetical protein